MLGVTRKLSGANIGSSMDSLVSFIIDKQNKKLVILSCRFRAIIIEDFWEILCW